MIKFNAQLTDKYIPMPYSQEDVDELKKYKPHQILSMKATGCKKPRSPKQLRMYWGICTDLAELISDHEFQWDKGDVDFEVKIRVSKEHPFIIKRFKMSNGIYHAQYLSISMDNMDHLEANQYFKWAYPIMAEMGNMTVEDLMDLWKSKKRKQKILIDDESGEEANNYDGTKPYIDEENNTVTIKELGCNCDPSSGSMCGGCIDTHMEYDIGPGERFYWKTVIG